MNPKQFEDKVRASLDRSVVAFNEGRPEFFDEFGDDATIFTADGKEPLKGREAYRQRYLSTLTSQKREKTIQSRNMQIVGDKAVVTQTARITENGSSADVLQTIVYSNGGEAVRVQHLHNALLTQQASESATPPPVRVVNERIAAVAAVLGVAQ
jgi:ketosteroid isomerase-like protein